MRLQTQLSCWMKAHKTSDVMFHMLDDHPVYYWKGGSGHAIARTTYQVTCLGQTQYEPLVVPEVYVRV